MCSSDLPGIERDCAGLPGRIGASGADTLGGLELLRGNDLQMGQHLGAALPAPQDTGIGQVADHAANGGMMPHLPGAGPVAQPVQISGNPLGSIALSDIFLEDDSDNRRFTLIDCQFKDLMPALVHTPAFHQIISIRSKPALESAPLDQLSEGGSGADRGFLTFPVCLPEADIVGEFVSVVVEALFSLLSAPDPDAVFHEPFHHKGHFVRDTANPVEHKHQQDIKPALPGVALDDLKLVAVLRPDFMAGHAILLLLMDDGPAFFLRKAVAGFSLHGDVRVRCSCC